MKSANYPCDLQPKLLRVLQEGEFERLGNSQTFNVDVRVITATNRDLKNMVAEGGFREDLYYRLSVFPLPLPALRDRRPDIPLLVKWFVNRITKKLGKPINSIPEEVMEALQTYAWPGNVRELENVIERAVILTSGYALSVPDFADSHQADPSSDTQSVTLESMEKAYIAQVLEKTNWRISGANGAAAILDIHPNTLRSRIQKLGIKRSLGTE